MSLESNLDRSPSREKTGIYQPGVDVAAFGAAEKRATGDIHDILEPLAGAVGDGAFESTLQQPKVAPVAYEATQQPVQQPLSPIGIAQQVRLAEMATNSEAANNPQMVEMLRALAVRGQQMDILLAMVSGAETDAERLMKLKQATSACPQLSAEEIIAVINHSDLVRNNLELREALVVGGKKVRDRSGQPASVYAMSLKVGEGGFGIVKDGYILRGGRLIPSVIKEPRNAGSAADGGLTKEQQVQRDRAVKLEASNAANYLKDPIDHVIRPSLISEDQKETGLPIIAYEKVVDRYGNATDFNKVQDNPYIAPSTKFDSFAGAIDGLAALHARGLVHLDFKPGNVMLDANGQGVVIDPGSLFSTSDTIKVIPPSADSYGSVGKSTIENGKEVLSWLGYTRQYLDIGKLYEAQQQGKSLIVADYHALGKSLNDILESSGLVPSAFAFSESPSPDAPLKKYLGLRDDQYPTAAVREMQWLMAELVMITSSHPPRPLTEVAADVRRVAQQMKLEVDQFHADLMQRRGVSPITTL
ncbi:hypothetical protein KA517_04505 [Candidatus Gracilibacteria bacterium]|nr:hypothetical protein [Candidatus Gracilibacteria bacterium]